MPKSVPFRAIAVTRLERGTPWADPVNAEYRIVFAPPGGPLRCLASLFRPLLVPVRMVDSALALVSERVSLGIA